LSQVSFYLLMVGILFILFFYLNIPFDPLKVLYGSMYEWQFLPWFQEVKNNLDAGIYPFFSFEVIFGQDILAESQQARLHIQEIIIVT
jgi:quinol-cytochrome oxidoreductase complex cytochrome b subunit